MLEPPKQCKLEGDNDETYNTRHNLQAKNNNFYNRTHKQNETENCNQQGMSVVKHSL
jgi:hypothetical protein